MDLNRLFIQNLKKWRKILGISQKKLAEKCGTGYSYIRQLESGVGQPSFALLGKIAEALNIEPYQLFYDETLNEAENKGKSYKVKYMESIQKKLLNDVSGDIQTAFDELKKYQ